MKSRLSLVVLLWSTLSTSAFARDFFLEPYVGLAKTQIKNNTTNYFDVADGFFLGVKAGAFWGTKLFFAGDYHTGGPYKFGPLTNNAEWNHSMLGAGFGLNYNIVRYWLGYYFNNAYEDRTFGVKYVGTGIKVGLGFGISSKLRCNLDLLFSSITKATIGGFEAPFTNYEISSTFVSISVPVDI